MKLSRPYSLPYEMQIKIPPDIQGRVFATLGQISMMLMPLAYLIAGPLVDQVFEPAAGRDGLGIVAPLVGSESGAGMGLIMLVSGAIMTLASVIALSPTIRHVEAALPDYQAVTASAEDDDQRFATPQSAAAEA